MSAFVIIAGPQAAGKSTVIANLTRQFRAVSLLAPQRLPVFPLQEGRQIIQHVHMTLGAIFMTRAQEREIAQCDLRRMDIVLRRRRDHALYLDECNIFTIAHAQAHGIADIGRYRGRYLERLAQLRAKVIFLDIPPALSWERRRRIYEERLIYFPKRRHERIMARYREYLERLYPLLHTLYQELPFPKELIDARMSETLLTEMVSRALARLGVVWR